MPPHRYSHYTPSTSSASTALNSLWGRPISLRSIRAFAFSPFCATSASASPRGRRERTVVRPLALGLASLNSHQTDENASLEGALFRYRSIRAFDALFRYRSIRALAPAMCSFHCAHTPTQPGYCPLGNTPCPFLGWLRRQSDRAKVSVEFAHISHKYIHFVTNVLKCARFGRYHRSFSVDDQGYT